MITGKVGNYEENSWQTVRTHYSQVECQIEKNKAIAMGFVVGASVRLNHTTRVPWDGKIVALSDDPVKCVDVHQCICPIGIRWDGTGYETFYAIDEVTLNEDSTSYIQNN